MVTVIDKRKRYLAFGIGIGFYVTSCFLAFLLLPSLFENNVFLAANHGNTNPTPEQLQNIVIVVLNHLLWTFGPFIVSGFILRMRRAGLYLAVLLCLTAYWRFQFIPLVFAGKVLMTGSWTLLTGALVLCWGNLE